MRKFFIVLILLVLAAVGYRLYNSYSATAIAIISGQTDSSATIASISDGAVSDVDDFSDLDDIAPTYIDLGSDKPPASTSTPQDINMASFSCDGRQHCSQMRSCAEATFFNNYCPNTKMDGNNDGVPCERQWC